MTSHCEPKCCIFSDEKEAVSDSEGTSTHVFYIVVGCICALIILAALAVAFFYITSQKANNRAYAEKIRYVTCHLTQGSHRLEKYLNLEDFLEKSLKIKYA